MVYTPFYVDPVTGFPTRIPDGAITNIGGTSSPDFRINGIPVLLADGTAADGSSGQLSFASLQAVYDNSSDDDGNASIKLETGKDIVIYDDTDNAVFFKVDSETGAVTITGDLIVGGNSQVVETSVNDADHWLISPGAPGTTALKIEPDPGVSLTAALVDVKLVNDGPSVFLVDYLGYTTVEKLTVNTDLTVNGLINGINLDGLSSTVLNHIAVSSDKHQAKEINIWPDSLTPFNVPSAATTVQTVLEYISEQTDNQASDIATLRTDVDDLINQSGSNSVGFTHLQSIPSTEWTITHNQGTFNLLYLLLDELNEQMIPDSFSIQDSNTVVFRFSNPCIGRANLMFYTF